MLNNAPQTILVYYHLFNVSSLNRNNMMKTKDGIYRGFEISAFGIFMEILIGPRGVHALHALQAERSVHY